MTGDIELFARPLDECSWCAGTVESNTQEAHMTCDFLSLKVATMNKLAREYNAGLEAAIEQVQQHNLKVQAEMTKAGVHQKHIKKSLLPIPEKCPENAGRRFCRRWLTAFNWRRASRNTSGQYLDSWWHDMYWYIYF